MFTRILVGLDGGVRADVALEQAVVLGRRFGATVVVAVVHERGVPRDDALAERARARVAAAPLPVETVVRTGDADEVLAEIGRAVDLILVGRRGLGPGGSLGATAASLVRIAERPVVVCGGAPSPLQVCAVGFDGSEPSRRALELAAQFASVSHSAVHVIHANDDPAAAQRVVGMAEMVLSFQAAPYHTYTRPGTPAAVVAAVAREIRADVLFTGAHVQRKGPGRESPVLVSHAEEIVKHTPMPVVVQP